MFPAQVQSGQGLGVTVQRHSRSNTVSNQLQTSAEIAYHEKKKKGGREADTLSLCAWKQLKVSGDSSAASWFETLRQDDTVALSNVQIYNVQSEHNLLAS